MLSSLFLKVSSLPATRDPPVLKQVPPLIVLDPQSSCPALLTLGAYTSRPHTSMRGYVPGIPVSYPVTHPDSPKLLKGVFPSALAVEQIISKLSDFRGACVARSVRRQTPGFSSDHDFAGRGIEPQDQLHAQWGVCLKIFALCSSPHSCKHVHTLSQIHT